MAINYSPIPTQSEAQTLYNSTVAAGKEARMNYAISYLGNLIKNAAKNGEETLLFDGVTREKFKTQETPVVLREAEVAELIAQVIDPKGYKVTTIPTNDLGGGYWKYEITIAEGA